MLRNLSANDNSQRSGFTDGVRHKQRRSRNCRNRAEIVGKTSRIGILTIQSKPIGMLREYLKKAFEQYFS